MVKTMTKNIWKIKKGFTLIELILAITVGSIILGVVGTYFTNAYVHALNEGRKTQLNSSAKAALERIVQDIRANETVQIYIAVGSSEITASGTDGHVIRCSGVGLPIWYRLNNSGTRLLKLQNANGNYTTAEENTSAACVNIKDFKVSIQASADNYTLYNMKLELSAGSGPNKVTTSVETQVTKYKTP